MRYKWREFYYIWLISFLIIINIYFGVFVWTYDLSPNFSLGFTSLIFIVYTIIIWRGDYKEVIKYKEKITEGKTE